MQVLQAQRGDEHAKKKTKKIRNEQHMQRIDAAKTKNAAVTEDRAAKCKGKKKNAAKTKPSANKKHTMKCCK